MALHEQCVGATDEWYTPPHVFDALGTQFVLDVASPGAEIVPWIPARRHITRESLSCAWQGFVWMNPPFGGRNGLIPWLEKFCAHGNGIALVPDRTSAPWWQQFVPRAELVLFVRHKIKFIGADGQPGGSPAQGTCLLASGKQALEPLHRANDAGLGVLMSPSHRARRQRA
jgi:DNA N-6-adenine-methyltransferase Dam